MNEETPLNVLNMELFGATKLMGEAIIKDYSRKYGLNRSKGYSGRLIDKTNEIYNLISPKETTTGELAELLKKKYGFEVVYNPIQKEGPSMPYMSSRKAIRELGWNPTSLEEGVERTFSEIKDSFKLVKAIM